jgi:hypothetical protein
MAFTILGDSRMTPSMLTFRWIEPAPLLDLTFPGGRPTASGKHRGWDVLFIRVRPATDPFRLAQNQVTPEVDWILG